MQSKAAYLIVLCCLLMHTTMLGSDVFFFHTVDNDGVLILLVSQAIAYLLYPLLGWLADVHFNRYKFVISSSIVMIAASFIMILLAALFINTFNSSARGVIFLLGGVGVSIGLIGMGLFESTAIQFGMDQMPEASSDQLSAFVQWYFWSYIVGRIIVTICSFANIFSFRQCVLDIQIGENFTNFYKDIHPYYFVVMGSTVLIMAGLQLVCACISLCLLVCLKNHFNIDRTGEHPLKLIYKVLKYAWQHKCPENRSAFTYWEEDIPPRIDLGKNKYGGPFTTEEVEDTKTFFSVLLVLLSMLGFHLSGHGYSLVDQLMREQCPSRWLVMFFCDPMHACFLVVVLAVPLQQLLARYCQKFFPNMLKRMGLGLLFCLIREIAAIIIHATFTGRNQTTCKHFDSNTLTSCYYLTGKFNVSGECVTMQHATHDFFHCDINDTPFLLLFIPNILQGLIFLLVFMTTLEFICAQAPLRLKGLLIGVWYALLAVNYLIVQIPEVYTIFNTTWKIFQAVKTFFIFVSLVVFMKVSKWYRYRLRDEVVNEQYLIEEIYERELDMAEQYQREGSLAYGATNN